MSPLKVFLSIYLLSIAFMYYISFKYRLPVTIPGDIFIKKGPRTIYFPIASSLLLTILLFLVAKYFFKF